MKKWGLPCRPSEPGSLKLEYGSLIFEHGSLIQHLHQGPAGHPGHQGQGPRAEGTRATQEPPIGRTPNRPIKPRLLPALFTPPSTVSGLPSTYIRGGGLGNATGVLVMQPGRPRWRSRWRSSPCVQAHFDAQLAQQSYSSAG